MRSPHNFCCTLILAFFLGQSVIANEGGAEAAKDEKSEAGKEDKDAAAAQAKKNPEWMDLNTQLQTLKSKIEMSEGLILKLVDQKNSSTDQKQSAEVISNLVKEHRSMSKTIEEYEQKRNQLKYRFPEAGLNDEREYERIEVKSLQDMENEFTITGRLQKAYNKVKRQYRKSYEEVQKERSAIKANRPAEKEKPTVKPAPHRPQENTLAEPAILSK
jgi:hypothetical protein